MRSGRGSFQGHSQRSGRDPRRDDERNEKEPGLFEVGFVNTNDASENNFCGILKFDKVPENIANVFVYPDLQSRLNNARPIHYFGIEFNYDYESELNVFEQAYSAVKLLERFKDEEILDV
jgi:hypothetical protein